MSVAAVCLNCNKSLPASITASSTSQVIRCDGCGSLLLWAAGRVVRAIRQADKLSDSPPGTGEAAPAGRDASTPPGRRPTPIERPLGARVAATPIVSRQGGAPPIPRPAPPPSSEGTTNANPVAGRASMPTRAAVAAVAPSTSRGNGFAVEDTVPGSPVATRGEAVDSGWHLGDDEVMASPKKGNPAIAEMVAASARSTSVSPPGAITAADREALDSGWAAEVSEGTPAPTPSPPPAPPALRLDNHLPPRRDRPMSFTPEPSVPGFNPSSQVPDSSPDWNAAARAALQLEDARGAVEEPRQQVVAPVAALIAPAPRAEPQAPVSVEPTTADQEAFTRAVVTAAPLAVAAAATIAPLGAVVASPPEIVTAPDVAAASDAGDREATREAPKAPEIEAPAVEATSIRAPIARPARGGRGGLVAAGVVGAVAVAIIFFVALRGPDQTVADHAMTANIVSATGTSIPARSEKDEPEVAAPGEHPAGATEAAVKVEAAAKLAAAKSGAAAKAQAAAKAAAEKRKEKARHAAEMKQQAAAKAEQARQAKADRITAMQRQREEASRARAEQAASAAQKKKEAQAARMAALQKRRQANLQQAESAKATRAERLAVVKQARAEKLAAVRSAKAERAAAAKAARATKLAAVQQARAEKLAAASSARAEKLAAVKAANDQRAKAKVARTERPARRERGGHAQKKSALLAAGKKKAQSTKNGAPIATRVERKRPARPETIVLDYDKPKRAMRGKRGRRHHAAAAASVPAPVAAVEPAQAPVSVAEPTPAEKEAQALDRARTVYREGSVKLFTGDFATAESAYQKSLMEFPGYVAAYRGLGLVYAKEDKAKEAVDAWSTYLQLVPRARDAWRVKRRMARLLRVHPELGAAAN